MVRVSGRVVSLVLQGHHVDSPEYRTRLGTIYLLRMRVSISSKTKSIRLKSLRLRSCSLKPVQELKKDNISTLGGRYNESIISHGRHQTCPFVTAAHVPNIKSVGHVQLVRPRLGSLLDNPSFSWRAPHTPHGCEGDCTLLTARVSSTILYFI